ncbi:hypothetical protein GCM10020229_45720 [Kitasatospora albolonga]
MRHDDSAALSPATPEASQAEHRPALEPVPESDALRRVRQGVGYWEGHPSRERFMPAHSRCVPVVQSADDLPETSEEETA